MKTALQFEPRKLTHAFVITTNPDKIRLDFKYEWFKSLSVNFITQFDYRNLNEKQLNLLFDCKSFLNRYGLTPSPGAIGCAAAHRECYRILCEEEGCCALIFEDDVLYDYRLIEAINEINNSILEYDVINLSVIQGVFHSKPVLNISSGPIYRASLSQFGAYAYLIHRGCAERFMNIQQPLIRHFSDWPLETWQFRCFGIHSNLTQFSGRPTTVQSSRLDHKPTLRTKIVHHTRLIWWRLMKFYRIRIRKDLVIE
ncbi:MAG: glycosyltransferase family 25 protein [Holophagaceae bacterium]